MRIWQLQVTNEIVCPLRNLGLNNFILAVGKACCISTKSTHKQSTLLARFDASSTSTRKDSTGTTKWTIGGSHGKRCATIETNHVSTVATKNVSICKEKMDCTMMSKVSIFISVKTVFTTMPKKAVASIQAGFLATKTVCVSIIPTGPKQTKGVNLDA